MHNRYSLLALALLSSGFAMAKGPSTNLFDTARQHADTAAARAESPYI